MTYSCPLCHLRFTYAAELDDHARDEHQPHDVVETSEHITHYTEERPAPRYVTPSM